MQTLRILLMILFAVPAFANETPQEFKELCQRDSDCRLLKLPLRGAIGKPAPFRWRMPSIRAMRQICERKTLIKTAAKEFEMPAKTISACLFSERTFLVNLADDIVDLAAKYGRGLSRDPSLGFVQMRISTATAIHHKVWGGRPSAQTVANALLNDSTSLRYMSALLARYRKLLRQENLSDSTEILCSLYLVGDAKKRTKQHAQNRTQPKSNFYGFFAQLHENLAEDLLNSDCSNREIGRAIRRQHRLINQK